MMKLIFPYISLFAILLLNSCINTEIVPEILEPKLSIVPKSVSLTLGQTTRLDAIYVDEKNIERPELVQWKSNMPTIAEVDASGVVTAKAIGQAWIVARVSSSLADSTLVTVVIDPNAVAKVEITAPNNTIAVGANLQFAVDVQNTNNQVIQGKTVIWQSDNNVVLSINNNGLATALTSGIAQVTATVDGIKSLPFTVTVGASSTSRSGTFRGNASYNVTGSATFEVGKVSFSNNFRTSSGPGLRVYLAKNAPGVLTSSNSVLLGNLKMTSGAQTYDVPTNVELTDFDFVVVYCQPFNVAFGFARLD